MTHDAQMPEETIAIERAERVDEKLVRVECWSEVLEAPALEKSAGSVMRTDGSVDPDESLNFGPISGRHFVRIDVLSGLSPDAVSKPVQASFISTIHSANSRSPPSSCELEVRNTIGHCGHGLSLARVSGGAGISSICVTCAAPWRCAVPTQSEPVSPPPRMTTRLPCAVPSAYSSIACFGPSV